MKLKITTGTNERPAVWIHGDIGEDLGGISPKDVREALEGIPDKQTIDVHIHSNGGSYQDSIAIHSILSRRKGGYDSIVDGKAYSGGSVIAVGGRVVRMQAGAWMMIHECHGSVRDCRADELRKYAEQMESVNDQLVGVYKPRWKGSEGELRNALRAETWIRDTDAVTLGLADVVDNGIAIAAYVDPAKYGYKNIPDVVIQSQHHKTPEYLARQAKLEEITRKTA